MLDPERLLRPRPPDWAAAASVRASAPTWPPPVRVDGRPLTTDGPTAMAGDLPRAVGGCSRGAHRIPCVHAPGWRWTCPRCAMVTEVTDSVPGPRLPRCDCWAVVCLHPPCRSARSTARQRPDGAATR